MKRAPASLVALAALAALAACGGPPKTTDGLGRVDIPVGGDKRAKGRPPAPREAPPPSGVAKPAPFPAVVRSKLANGMSLACVTSRALPIVQIRVVVAAGSGYGPSPGVAELTGELLEHGGTRSLASAELLRRVETLGATLQVTSDLDATVVSTAVTSDHLAEALDLVGQVVREPRFDEGELRKLKARATDAAEDRLRSRGQYTSMHLVFAELYPPGAAYRSYGVLPSDIAKVDGQAIRDFYRRAYVPKAAELVLAGAVDAEAAKALAEEHFGKWTGGAPLATTFAPPRAPEKRRVIVASRPKSVQSDVFVATIAPPRAWAGWPAVRVATHVLGGGPATRLFVDVREQRSLAYRTHATILETAHGDEPLVVYAGTETSKTSQAVAGLLEDMAKMSESPPSDAETEMARRYLADALAIRMETIGAVADLVVAEDELGLPDGYWDAYRKDLAAVDVVRADAAAKSLFDPKRPLLVVVAGDADAIANDLTRFGEVVVVDPENDMKTIRTIPEAPR